MRVGVLNPQKSTDLKGGLFRRTQRGRRNGLLLNTFTSMDDSPGDDLEGRRVIYIG